MSESWSPQTRERFFYVALGLTVLGVVWLFLPFLDVILFAGVVATVSKPLHSWLSTRMGGRRMLAAVVVLTLQVVLVFLPVSLLLYRTMLDLLSFAAGALDDLSQPQGANWLVAAQETWLAPMFEMVKPLFEEDADVIEQLSGQARTLATQVLQQITTSVPTLLGSLTAGVIDGLLFLSTVVVLLSDGDRLTAFVRGLSPLDTAYEQRLIDTFREFATNMVIGGFGTAAAMGLVSTIGYLIFGVPRPIFFGMLTAVGSFAPVVGTAVVAAPLVAWVGFTHGLGWAGGLLLWSVTVTGTTDNLLRPFFMRGSSDIHPLLLFFAVFGGMYWMGVTGVLVGPVVIAFFLTLAHILQEHLEEENGEP